MVGATSAWISVGYSECIPAELPPLPPQPTPRWGIKSNHSNNHKSCAQFHKKVSKRLLEEIEDGNYIKTAASEVKLISPLAAILKPDGDVRVIHDLSYPQNNSLNDYASKE